MKKVPAKVVYTFECPSCEETMKVDFNGKPIVTCIHADCELEGIEFLPPARYAQQGNYEKLREAR